MKAEKDPAETTAKGREFQRSIIREKKEKFTKVKSDKWFEESEWVAASDRCRTKSEVKRWIQVSMVMQDTVDSALIDKSTATGKSWYIESG